MIELREVAASAGSFSLSGVNLLVPAGGYGVLMGSTGCGKTTLLEVICGLRGASAGSIHVGGREVTGFSPGSRGIGYVPQDGALFPAMTVSRHLGFALAIRKRPAREIEQRVGELAAELGIAHLLDRLPAGLSGGERQRVALGRALAANPMVLLLDEPISALDADMRAGMRTLLKRVHLEHGVTVLHVTHDLEEAEDLGQIHFRWQQGAVAQIS